MKKKQLNRIVNELKKLAHFLFFTLIISSCASTKPSQWFFYENGEVAIQESLQRAIQEKVAHPSFERCLVSNQGARVISVVVDAHISKSGKLEKLKIPESSEDEVMKKCVGNYLKTLHFEAVPTEQSIDFRQKFNFKIAE